MHLIPHQGVSHSSEPTLQTEHNVVWKTFPPHTLSSLTRLPLTRCFLWCCLAMAWDVSCLLTRLPHLHRDFIFASVHYQFVFFDCRVSPQRMSLLPFCCLSVSHIYWYSTAGKSAIGGNLMDSMLPAGGVKGRIYYALLLSKALGTERVFLWGSTGTGVHDNSANWTWFYCW